MVAQSEGIAALVQLNKPGTQVTGLLVIIVAIAWW